MRRLNPPSTKIQLILARCLLGFPGSVCATSRSSGSDLQSCLSLASLPFDLDSSLSFYPTTSALLGFPGGSEGKASACNVGDSGSIPGLGRPPEKEMAAHSRTLAWKIPWTEEPGGPQSTGSPRVARDRTASLLLSYRL